MKRLIWATARQEHLACKACANQQLKTTERSEHPCSRQPFHIASLPTTFRFVDASEGDTRVSISIGRILLTAGASSEGCEVGRKTPFMRQ